MKHKILVLFLLVNFSYGNPSSTQKTPTVGNIILLNHKGNFVGRTSELKRLNNILQTKHIVAISGPGGIGKTGLAKQYAKQYKSQYSIIWWFDTRKQMGLQFKSLATELNKVLKKTDQIDINTLSETTISHAVISAILKSHLKALFIFDDAKKTEDVVKYFTPDTLSTKSIHILIPSRNMFIWEDHITLGIMSECDSKDYLKEFLDTRSEEDKSKLLSLVKGYPLLLVQSASYLKKHPSLSMVEYFKLFKSRRKHLLAEQKKFLDKNKTHLTFFEEYHEVIDGALGLSFQTLKSESKNSFDLLMLISFMYNQSIKDSLLKLLYTSFTQGKGIGFQEAIDNLLEHSILEVSTLSNISQEASYNIHEMTQLVARDSLSPTQKEHYVKFLANFLADIFKSNNEDLIKFFSTQRNIISHTEVLLALAKEENILDKNIITLKVYMLNYFLYVKRDHKHSLKLIAEIDEDLKKHKVNSIAKADFLIDKGAAGSLYFVNEPKKHLEFREGLLEASKILSSCPVCFKSKIRALYNLAFNYLLIGDSINAETYLEQAEKLLPYVTNSNKIHYYYYKTWATEISRNYEDGIKFADIALNILESEPDSPIKFYLYIQKAKLGLYLQQYELTYKYALLAYKKCKTYFGNEDNDVLSEALSLLSSACLMRGNISDAMQYSKESLKAITKFRPNSEDEALAHTIYGDVLTYKKKYIEAKKEYDCAKAILFKVLTELKHPRVSKLLIKQNKLGLLMKDAGYALTNFALHKKIFGIDHEGTKEIIKNHIDLSCDIVL